MCESWSWFVTHGLFSCQACDHWLNFCDELYLRINDKNQPFSPRVLRFCHAFIFLDLSRCVVSLTARFGLNTLQRRWAQSVYLVMHATHRPSHAWSESPPSYHHVCGPEMVLVSVKSRGMDFLSSRFPSRHMCW